MLPKKYLSDDVHNLLKSEYATITEQSENLLTNLEDLNSEQRITEGQYEILKNEYHLINKGATHLLANMSERDITEEKYKEMKDEYSEKLSDSMLALASIKRNIKNSISETEGEIKRYNDELEKNDIRYKTGEIKQYDHDKIKNKCRNKIEEPQKTLSELNKLASVESSKDISVVVKRQRAGALKDVSMPSGLSGLSDKLPQGIPVSGVIGRLKFFISGFKDKYWGLTSFYKILAGILFMSVVPIILYILMAPILLYVSTQIYSQSMMTGQVFGSWMVLYWCLAIVTYIGYLIISITGLIMLIYGVWDAWYER